MTEPVIRPPYWDDACAALSAADPVMAGIIAEVREEHLRPRHDPFLTLARSIVGQQISVKAADSVWQKVVGRLGGISAEAVAATSETDLLACGLSRQKAKYLASLATHFQDGSIALSAWPDLDDEAVIAALCGVKGIGRWTAEMFLIFHLMRPDVLPLADIGLQRAMRLHYNADSPVDRAAMMALAEPWRPWRSVATWYLWRSLDPVPVDY